MTSAEIRESGCCLYAYGVYMYILMGTDGSANHGIMHIETAEIWFKATVSIKIYNSREYYC
jgi:hypothetical protein